ncbi:MAG: hypothetical protein JO104_05645, partial [Candidatus Eremiobacteraeota bacterium]|nr:hypothetical protein [Candidatus Eremiobacteraeota bacterium]
MKTAFGLAVVAAIAMTGAPCIALALPSAAPSTTVELIGGTTVVRQPDPTASLVGVAFVVRAGLDRQTMKQNGLAALVAETIVRTPVGTLPLQEAIAARGGSV